MFCKQCGKSIPDNSKFCQHCGADQEIGSPDSNQNGEQNIHSVFSKKFINIYSVFSKKFINIHSVFSKKFIFGTVVSFLVTTAGIVTVFFPSLLNLEKNSIKELSITIDTQSDANILYKFLTDNKNKIVSLDIKYSPKKIQASNYEDKSFFKREYFSQIPVIASTFFCNNDSAELDDSDRYFKICDIYTNVLLNKIEYDFNLFGCYEQPNVYNCTGGLMNKSKDGVNLINHGLIIDGVWYCSPMDLSCQQERVAKFETQNNEEEFQNIVNSHRKDLFYLPDYPYPATIFEEPAADTGARYLHSNSSMTMNESVLFGSRLTFLANHYKASYSNGVVNIDHGSIGFITDGTDNQIEPYYLHGERDDFEQDAKNVKVLRLFQNDNLVSAFKNQKEYAQEVSEYLEFKGLVTSLFKVNGNKLEFSDNREEKIIDKFYVASGDVIMIEDIHNVMYNSTFDKSFSIEIPYSSQNNKLYTWKSDSLRSRYPNVESEDDMDMREVFSYKDNHEMISIKGTFYVYAENEVENETDNFMPYHFCGYQLFSEYLMPIPCKVQKTIKLEPLSAVDLEKRKY